MDVAEAYCEPRIGSLYRIVRRNRDVTQGTTSGIYQELEANRHLVHTWQWDG